MFIWKAIFVIYALFVAADVMSLPSRRPFLPTGIGSLLGVVAAIPMFGYAFRVRIVTASIWKLSFLIQVLGLLVGFSALIYEQIAGTGSKIVFSPVLLLAFPAVFVLMFPWFMYAFRSPDIWARKV